MGNFISVIWTLNQAIQLNSLTQQDQKGYKIGIEEAKLKSNLQTEIIEFLSKFTLKILLIPSPNSHSDK